MPRSLLVATLALGLTTLLPAQANDYAGMRIFVGTGLVGAPARLTCGTPFDCTPFSTTVTPGDTVQAALLGTLNGPFLILGTFDTANLTCIPLGIPGIVNDLVLPPGRLLVLAVGACVQPDNGRCNGGSATPVFLFQIPQGINGSFAFQALIETPLSVGGLGFALTKAVVINF